MAADVVRHESKMFHLQPHFHIDATESPTVRSFAIFPGSNKSFDQIQVVLNDRTTPHRRSSPFLLNNDSVTETPSKSVLMQPSVELRRRWIMRPIRLRVLRPSNNALIADVNRNAFRRTFGAEKAAAVERPRAPVDGEIIAKDKRTNVDELKEESISNKPDNLSSTSITFTTITSATTPPTTSSSVPTTITESATFTTTVFLTSFSSTPIAIESVFTNPSTTSTTDLPAKVTLSQSSAPPSIVVSLPRHPQENITISSESKEELNENLINGVQPTLTPPTTSTQTSTPSLQLIGAPGAEPPSDSVVDELNRAENFMEVAQRLRLFEIDSSKNDNR
ncbi:hypothetical protein KIN20_024401 [Parelaphostrongylus tenuis]|uniref:Uncharacterized protein n=1 Tax=Parelaphostrongylus tenuis TaxID=148309 RepID=A0AAD5N7J2_PARTN|nr:hypothetical protein KIN20_024401 [Parelaphostrongylus tenuis]